MGSRLEGGSSACTGSRSVGIPRSGSPQRAGAPRVFPFRGQKVSPHHLVQGHRKMHFSVRTSTTCGADVHEPKGYRKTLYRKCMHSFSGALGTRADQAQESFWYRNIQMNYRQTFLLEEINFQLQIQNRAARRINFHYRGRSVEISSESLS